MRVALSLDDEQLRRRVERVLASFPDITLDADDGRSSSIEGGEIPLPADATRHLAGLLAADVERRSGTAASVVAATIPDTPLSQGTAIAFPPPVGSVWGEAVGSMLLGPVDGRYAAAFASNDTVTLAAADDARFLGAIITAAPIIAAARGIAELAAASLAGLSIAERG